MFNEVSDEFIFERVKQGDISEFAIIFNRYNTPLVNYFFHLTSDKGLSEDLTQDTFYKILRSRSTFNAEIGAFRTWMYKIARNTFIDYCNDAKTKETCQPLDEFSLKDLHISVENEEGSIDELHLLISKLKPLSKELIILSRFQGLKYSQIAEIKGMSLGSVKIQIYRAFKELRSLVINVKR